MPTLSFTVTAAQATRILAATGTTDQASFQAWLKVHLQQIVAGYEGNKANADTITSVNQEVW